MTGWASEKARAKFHADMLDRVKNYADWDKRAVEEEVFDRVRDSLATGDSPYYELSMHHTISRTTELINLDLDDFSIEEEVE